MLASAANLFEMGTEGELEGMMGGEVGGCEGERVRKGWKSESSRIRPEE